MTRTKFQRKIVTHSRPVKSAKSRSSKRPVPVIAASGGVAKTRAGSKNARVVSMLQDRTGTTIAAIMAATGWQQHWRERCSVRHVDMTISFLAPKLVRAAVEGRLPRGINIARLRDAPAEWSRQFEALGLNPHQ
jgi:uncharacterized protein DUF3489